MDQSNMEIFAPNNGDLNVALKSEYTSFTNNKIHSALSTESIVINCELGRGCDKNIINGQQLTTKLEYRCNSYCDSTEIVCSNDAECDIHCKDSCNNMIIHAQNKNNLVFVCDEKECKNTMIECMINDTLYQSQYTYSNDNDTVSIFGPCTSFVFMVIFIN